MVAESVHLVKLGGRHGSESRDVGRVRCATRRPYFAVSRVTTLASLRLRYARRLNMKKAGPLVADQLILDPELFLLELVEADIVRMGAMFLFVDERLELSMLLFEGVDLGLVHRSHSFRRCGLTAGE